MKTLSRKSRATIPASRWLAYAGSGAATALAGVGSAEGEIHYSGPVNIAFQPDDDRSAALQLDQPGDSLVFAHFNSQEGGKAMFKVEGHQSGKFAGNYGGFEFAFVDRLKSGNGHYVSEKAFISANGSGFHFGTLFNGSYGRGQWNGKGTGFVGFRFNNGSGIQYGWARVRMKGEKANWAFQVLDYAYGDPGEPILTGQTNSSSSGAVPDEGSLGLLAVGAAGLALWRERRRHTSPR